MAIRLSPLTLLSILQRHYAVVGSKYIFANWGIVWGNATTGRRYKR